MGRKRRYEGFALVLAALATAGIGPAVEPPAVEQPLRFNHKRHVDEGMACTDCHSRAATSPQAGHPLIKTCMLCHQEPKGDTPDEAKLREFAAAGRQIPWVTVNRMPGHVYFSHEAHLTYGKLDCAECHGDVKSRETPTIEPQVSHLDMRACMSCHAARGASNDCITCHK